MDMQGSRPLAATQQQAWDALNDPEVLKTCIPGCDKIEATGEHQYAVGLALKIGPVAAKFAGRIVLSDIAPPRSYTLTFDGQGGAAGFGKGSAQVSLTPGASGAGGCTLAYSVNAQVGGKIAQIGQRLIDGAAKSLAEDFFKRFDEALQRRFPVADVIGNASKTIAENLDPIRARGQKSSKLPAWAWIVGAIVIVAVGAALLR